MTISTALNAGVAGLNVNATRLSTISDNIANSGTHGYKRMQADFHSMVIGGTAPGVYSVGGVRATTQRLIDERGPLVSTTNPTDLAVAGRGFLPVTPGVSLGNADTPPLHLVTTGSFRPDVDGILRTESGMVLLGWPANSDGAVPTFPRDTVGGLEPVRIAASQFVGDPTTRIEMGVNLPATATRAGAAGDPIEMSVEYYDNLGVPGTLIVRFSPDVPALGAANSWTMEITDPADNNVLIGSYALSFDDSPTNGGALQAVTQPAGAPGLPFDAATGAIGITTAGGNDIELVLGAGDSGRGLTQVSDRFAPIYMNKNGTPVGNLVSVQVDERGFLDAVYDTGFVRTIWQIPVVDVPNPNGLTTTGSGSFTVSTDSGPFFLWNSGDGPTGPIAGFAREESATDVAAELTRMIQTQRAYTSNAKVIQTVDEMLQETTNLKR